ncbi:MAG: PSD1 and planctomycete cytochrome C domain-containing protein [Planctomycetota bacterium]|nr:PSD1 and planctomycete cytochrome C domain-containing protein [Planctomycetota bacterium]
MLKRSLLLSLIVFVSSQTFADDGAVFFGEYIEPLLKQHCYECHSHEAGEASGGLVLDSKAGWTVGGDSGPAIVPREPGKSLLWRAVAYQNDNLQMPPEGKLTAGDLSLLKKWIESGAFDPRTGGQAAQRKTIDIAVGKQWWAFRPMAQQQPRKSQGSLSLLVDDAVRSELAEYQLTLSPPAARNVLIRRVTYDLTGLPPNYFSFGDASYEQIVDQLLASRHFGEKWGRHWLDVARYADSNGSSFNPPFPQAWRYRNWLIDSFNADLPIDRFLQMQIAGDLLPYETQQQRDDSLIATGYLLLGSKVLGTFDKEQLTLDVIDEQLDTIGKSLLGMTLGCARCHDHKFDPIPQRDYYALAGIFSSTVTLDDRLGGPKEDESDWSRRGLGEGGDEQLQEFLSEHRYAWIKATSKRFQAAKKVDETQSSDESEHSKELTAAREELAKADATLAEFRSKLPPYAMAVRDQVRPGDVAIRIRGVAASHGDVVPRGFLQVASFEGQPNVNPSASGRLEFAQWLTAPQNPLTARVFVNRIWKHLFREGLVRSVDNFGTTGEQPSHPQLLDNLATQFIANGWKLKPLVRELVVSQTYRQSVGSPPQSDPENRLLSCQHRRRLDPEEIRDTLLVLSGRLDATSGEGMLDSLPISDVSNLGDYLKIQDNRRTIYQPVIRTLEPDVLQLFDSANNAMVTGARPKTVVAPQALYFLNSSFVQSSAERIAATKFEDTPRDASLSNVVDETFAWIAARPPTDAERRLLVDYLQRQADGPPGLTRHDIMKLCQTILGSTQFQFVE